MKNKIKPIISNGLFTLMLLPFLAVLATVFVIDNGLAKGIVSGKYFWFYLCMGAIAVSTTISFLVRRRAVPYAPSDLCVFIFVAMVVYSAYWLRGYTFYTKEVLLALLFALYLFFRVFMNQYRHALFLLTLGFMLTGLIEAVWGLRQLYGFERSQHTLFSLTGSLFNPGPYGGYLAVCFPMAIYYLLNDWQVVKRKYRSSLWPFFVRWGIAALTVIAIISVLPATMSRSAWVAALGGSLISVILFLRQNKYGKQVFEQHKKQIRRWGIVLLLIAIIASVGMYFLKKDSADGRLLIWKVCLSDKEPCPLSQGIGIFPHLYGKLQTKYLASDKATEAEKLLAGNPEYAFNEYLQLNIENGLFSLIAFIFIMVYTLIAGIKRKRAGAVSSLSALFLFAFTSYPFSVLPFLIVMVFLMAACCYRPVIVVGYYYKTPGFYYLIERYINTNRVYIAFMLLVGIVITVFCLNNRKPTYQAYKQWAQVKLLYQSGLYQDAGTAYREIYPLLNDQTDFLFEYGRTLHQTGHYKESLEVLQQGILFSCDPMFYNLIGKNYQALRDVSSAREAFQKSIGLVPHRLYPYYLTAKLYMETGAIGEARKWAQIVVEKEPKVPSTAIIEMKTEMKKFLSETENHVEETPVLYYPHKIME